MSVLWCPLPAMQTELLQSAEFEVFAGGAAGPGKSECVLADGLRYIDRPTYRGLILRSSFPELRELMDRAHEVFPQLGGVWNENEKRWTFRSGATYEFGYCSVFADVQRYRGQEFGFIGYDEIGDLGDERVWTFLFSRCRSKDPLIPPRMRCTANPGGRGHTWLRKRFIEPCGVDGANVYTQRKTGLTRRFIPGRVLENPLLIRNNPTYVAQLMAQPELIRRQLLEGDWDAGAGAYFEELSDVHLVRPFPVPPHWRTYGSFDWGFSHPFAFGLFAVDEDGGVWLIDSVHGRRLLDREIVERIKEQLGEDLPRYAVAGADCWHDIKARSESGPTTADTFAAGGLPLMRANISRIAGWKNVRNYLAWRGQGEDGGDGVPRFRMFDTPGNRKVFEVLESLIADPDNPEDVLKVDADGDGIGGDDSADMIRYGLMQRPLVAKAPEKKAQQSPHFDRAYEAHMHRVAAANRPGGRGF
jgi:hypothetical protein